MGVPVAAARFFSTSQKPDADEFKEKAAKFFDFIEKAEEIDEEVRQQNMDMEIGDLDIAFDGETQPDAATPFMESQLTEAARQIRENSE